MSDDEPGQQARRAAEALLDGCENAGDIADYHDVSHSTGNNYVEALREYAEVEYLPSEFRYDFDTDELESIAMGGFETAEPEEPVDAGPDPDDLSERQQYIVNRIAADAPTRDELADDLGVDTRYVRWWELSHSQLVREFRGLPRPTAEQPTTDSGQDLVVHLTDVHMGDRVRDDSGNVIYSPETAVAAVDHVTEKAIALAERHRERVTVDTVHLLWGGDMLTNEAIYSGQFEDLSAWLDEQHDRMVPPLLRQVKALSESFPAVNVVAKTGNHGEHRASGKSRQANADLILYKSVRNAVAAVRDHAEAEFLDNVSFQIGEAQNFKNFEMRDGRLTGHLRHGQQRKAGFRTSAARKEWSQTLLRHEFDVAWMGHVHRQQQFSVNGRPVFVGAQRVCRRLPRRRYVGVRVAARAGGRGRGRPHHLRGRAVRTTPRKTGRPPR